MLWFLKPRLRSEQKHFAMSQRTPTLIEEHSLMETILPKILHHVQLVRDRLNGLMVCLALLYDEQ